MIPRSTAQLHNAAIRPPGTCPVLRPATPAASGDSPADCRKSRCVGHGFLRGLAGCGLALTIAIAAVSCDQSGGASGTDAGAGSNTSQAPKVPDQPKPVMGLAGTEATAPGPSFVVVDRQPVRFPPAKLILTQKDGGVHALLFSMDPPEALRPGYTGNSYYFDMTLDVPTLADLPQAVWAFSASAPGGDAADSPNGLFLAGGQQVLTPQNVQIAFTRDGQQTLVDLQGTFRIETDAPPTAGPRLVDSSARLMPVVVIKK